MACLKLFELTNTHLHRLHHPLAGVLTCRGRYQTAQRQKNRNSLKIGHSYNVKKVPKFFQRMKTGRKTEILRKKN